MLLQSEKEMQVILATGEMLNINKPQPEVSLCLEFSFYGYYLICVPLKMFVAYYA